MPGKKGCASLQKSEERLTFQIRLVLLNLWELYRNFNDMYPDVMVGFSKLTELRPPYCILAGVNCTHSLCVCTIHENVKLLFESMELCGLETSDETSIQSYQHCIAHTMCHECQYVTLESVINAQEIHQCRYCFRVYRMTI
uniref:Uncharacterized protein n=1 Tax=Amphimedon queenslandica TaxID=400682 RepID=A0A1X7UR03_AMPQE